MKTLERGFFKFSALDRKFQNTSCSNAPKMVIFFAVYSVKVVIKWKWNPFFRKILAGIGFPCWIYRSGWISSLPYSEWHRSRGLMHNPSNKSQISCLWQSRIKKWSSARKTLWSIKSCTNTLQSTLISGWKAFKGRLFKNWKLSYFWKGSRDRLPR